LSIRVRKTAAKNGISHDLRFLGCDLMWKICVP
jgi:hypothetical protein